MPGHIPVLLTVAGQLLLWSNFGTEFAELIMIIGGANFNEDDLQISFDDDDDE